MKYVLIISGLIIVFSCSGEYSPKEKLEEALFRYTTSLRWNNYQIAQKYIVSKPLLEYYKQMDKADTKISDYEIEDVQLDEKAGVAFIRLRIYWYSLKSAQLYATLLEQKWEEREGEWLLVKERILEGKSL